MSDRFPTAATPDRPELEVSVANTVLAPLVQADIVEVDASEEIGRHARLTLLVQNWDADKQAVRHSDGATFAPGKAISLRLGYHAKLERVFDGVITALGGHFSAGSGPTLRVEARSRSVQLAYPPRSRLLEQANDGDIAGAIAADYSLTADAEDGIDQDFVVIDGRSDWEHLTERAAALGWVTYVRDTTLVFKPPAQPPKSPPELAWGRNLTELQLTQDLAAVADPIVATGWDPDAQQAADGQAGASRSTVAGGGRQAVDAALSDARWPLRRQHVPLTTPLPLPELEQLAVGQATADALRHFTGRGATIGLPALRADSWVSITGVGSRMSGSHYVSAVRHRMSARGYVTEFQLGRGQPLQPPPAPAGARPALRVAVVQDLDDPEKWGRVKVGLPYRKDAPDALWARIATLDAGPSQGSWFVPDVGQEVVIATLGDDDRHPVVLGALWNGQQSPPEQMDPQKNDIRAIVTRAGHKIRFDDGDPATVEVSTAGGRTVLLDDGNSAVEVKEPDGPCSIKLSGSGIELTAKGGDIKLTASAGKLIVDATGIEAKSSGAAKLESSATLDVKASAKLTLSGAMVAIN